MSLRRTENVYSWNQSFMEMARTVANRSKDPSTQVGAVIADSDHRILSVGYNGSPISFADSEFPWGKTNPEPLFTKYPYVIHAERNCILNFRGLLSEMGGSTLYVTHFPCNECAKEIAQVGIKQIITTDPGGEFSDWDWSLKASSVIFRKCGILVATEGNTVWSRIDQSGEAVMEFASESSKRDYERFIQSVSVEGNA